MKKYCFGVDVGGTTIKMGLFTVEGELLEKWEIPTRTENQSEAVLPDVAAAVKGKMEEKGIAKEEVAGVGFGVPGPVTEEGVIVMNANLGWRDKHVSKELEELRGAMMSRQPVLEKCGEVGRQAIRMPFLSLWEPVWVLQLL